MYKLSLQYLYSKGWSEELQMISQRFSQIFWFHGTAHTRSILILLHQQRKGFQRKWSHFPGSGRQSQIMQTTIRCHCHTATTPQPQICLRKKNCPRKKCPRRKKVHEMSEKKNCHQMLLPLQPHLSRYYEKKTDTVHPKGGISLLLQAFSKCSKRRG